jgi:hypothetical protein
MNQHPYEARRAEAERIDQRARAILAERLEKQVRSPLSVTSEEYVHALDEASAEIDRDEAPAVDRDRLVSSPGARAAVDARAQAILAARGTDVTAETYLAACLEAENELYPRSAFDG